MIAANSFGSGVTDILDLSGRNNPFSQATPASRGAWFREPKRGRVNLLNNSVFAGGVSGTPGTLPTGLTTGNVGGTVTTVYGNDAVICDVGSASRITFRPADITVANGQTLTVACDVLVTSGSLIASQAVLCGVGVAGTTVHRINGVVVSAGTVIAVGVLSRVEVSVTFSAGGSTINQFGVGASANLGSAVVATISRPQIEFATQSTAYQRVTTAFDVTEQGQRDCYGVLADGIDDFYTTASIDFTGTNKVTVFAAMRKVSDAAIGVVTELTTNTNSENGSFFLAAPSSLAIDSARNVGFNARGTATGTAAVATGLASPVTFITTGQADIAAPSVSIRSNGVLIQTTTATLGSGSFANDILYLFRRGGATFPFNGRLYALIVAGGSYPLSTIQRVERLLSRITPTVNL